MKEYEYKFEKVDIGTFADSYKHREVIEKYASEGYKFTNYIPVNITSEGRIRSVDLIFEKETEK